jgi:AcrR family transcriptional regulator
MIEQVTASDGRVIGARALKTRRRLLDATVKLLRENGALDLRVIDVTREIGSSPATFYQYFADVEEAILALAIETVDEVEELRKYLEPAWTEADGPALALELVSGFMEYRDRNQAILRLRDLKAAEGDQRFRVIRQQGYAGLMADLIAKIEAAKVEGRVQAEINAYTAAAGVLAMLEQVSAYQAEIRRRSVTREAMASTIASVVLHTVTGYHR